ncbi:hypothetical protein ACVINW_003436 [Bradyrhizobium sp. USDA 4461]
MMNSRRVRAATLGGTVVLSGCIVSWFAAFGSAGIEKIGASVADAPVADASVAGASIDGSRAPTVIADAVSATSPATGHVERSCRRPSCTDHE